jgi:hypothetical protein
MIGRSLAGKCIFEYPKHRAQLQEMIYQGGRLTFTCERRLLARLSERYAWRALLKVLPRLKRLCLKSSGARHSWSYSSFWPDILLSLY